MKLPSHTSSLLPVRYTDTVEAAYKRKPPLALEGSFVLKKPVSVKQTPRMEVTLQTPDASIQAVEVVMQTTEVIVQKTEKTLDDIFNLDWSISDLTTHSGRSASEGSVYHYCSKVWIFLFAQVVSC